VIEAPNSGLGLVHRTQPSQGRQAHNLTNCQTISNSGREGAVRWTSPLAMSNTKLRRPSLLLRAFCAALVIAPRWNSTDAPAFIVAAPLCNECSNESGTILLIILVLLLIGAFPTWPHSAGWGTTSGESDCSFSS